MQDTFAVQKPDPDILKRTIAAAGGDANAAIMVGDSEHGRADRAGGRDAGDRRRFRLHRTPDRRIRSPIVSCFTL